MAISKVENPATGEEITVIKGVVERVMFKEAVNDKFGATHRASVLIDGDWVGNISIKTKEGYDPQIRFNNGNNAKPDWQTLDVGDEVRLVVTENVYNDKVYYNSGTSKIKLVKKGEGAAKANPPQQRTPQGSQNASGGFKKDNHEVVAGNARTAAFAFLKGVPYENVSDVNDLVQKFARYSDKKRKQYKEEHPELDDFQVGVSVGQAVVLAAPLAKDFDALDVIVDDILGSVIPYSVGVVKGIASGELSEEQPKQQAKPAQKAKPQPKPVEQEPEDDFEDQDLPF